MESGVIDSSVELLSTFELRLSQKLVLKIRRLTRHPADGGESGEILWVPRLPTAADANR